MPLHDWNEQGGWSGVHHLWIAELLRWVKPRLPQGYRAYIASAPLIAIDEPDGSPDVSVRRRNGARIPPPDPPSEPTGDPTVEPDEEFAVATLDATNSLFVARDGWLVTAVELVSPRNKDRPSSRVNSTNRYAGYLLGGANLMLIDVHPRPYAFSFAESIAAELNFAQARLPAPQVLVYRVGESMGRENGCMLGIWRRSLQKGATLPSLPLPLTVHESVMVDLESTYSRAAADAYLE